MRTISSVAERKEGKEYANATRTNKPRQTTKPMVVASIVFFILEKLSNFHIPFIHRAT